MFAFEMTLEVAIEFYRRRNKLNAKTEEQCTHILLQMVKEGLIKEFEETKETKAEYMQRLAKTKKVLKIEGKSNANGKTKGKADGGEAGTAAN